MAEKQISFSGLNLTPYADISPDGQLSASVGLEVHDGSLRPSVLAGEEYTLPEAYKDAKLVFVHTSGTYRHFIFCQASSGLCWADVTAPGQLSVNRISGGYAPESLQAVGNTLIGTDSNSGIHYWLWKNGNYKYLGQKPPEPVMSFSLLSWVKRSEEFRFTEEGGVDTYPGKWVIKDEYIESVNIRGHAAINKFISERQDEGFLIYPFLVRYAYRLYDGTHVMQSAPVLMIPNDNLAPSLLIYDTADSVSGDKYRVGAFCSWLGYACSNSSGEMDAVREWGDIVKGLDIFLSPQFYTHDINGRETEITLSKEYESATYGSLTESPDYYAPRKFYDAYKERYPDENLYGMVPFCPRMEFKDEIRNASLFYHVKSLELDELSNEVRYLFGSEGDKDRILSNLALRERLDDDYMTHDMLVPRFSMTYNQRFHIADVSRIFFKGHNPDCLYQRVSARGDQKDVSVYTFIHGNDGDVIVKSDTGWQWGDTPLFYLYYPDPDAYKMVILIGTSAYEYPLEEHPMLNGAYYFDMSGKRMPGAVPSVTSLRSETLRNKIFVSEVGNPFRFPLEGVYTVGTGEIFAMCPVTTALSQGQFGQFPLIAFCSDGNYALSVNSEGGYSTVSPIQRDVCANADSVTQMDSEVLFVSSRGVMVTDGASINCVSLALDGVFEKIPEGLDTIAEYPDIPPVNAVKEAMPIYDYSNQRVIFALPGKNFSLVLSLAEYRWSTAEFGRINAALNVFPYSFVQFHTDGRILWLRDVYDYSSETVCNGLIVTRALKLDSMQLKRLLRISVEGIFNEKQKLVVYASQNGTEWFGIGSSTSRCVNGIRGRYFKYYRFAVETALTPKENISGFRTEYHVRPERRMR